jgi:pyruvate dehydrogenase E1 component beta subunit
MTRKISFKQAINEAMAQEMARDESVIAMGEDNVGGQGGEGEMDAWGGVLGVTKGLYGKFGDRIIDTPISESAFIVPPSALRDLRPVAGSCLWIFMGVCFDRYSIRRLNFATCLGARR